MKTIDTAKFIEELDELLETARPKGDALQNPDVAIWWRGVETAILLVQTAAAVAAKETT